MMWFAIKLQDFLRYFRRFLEINVICTMHLRRHFSHFKWEVWGWFCIFFCRDPEVLLSSVCPCCRYLWSSVTTALVTAWRCSNGSCVSKVHLVLSQLPFLDHMVNCTSEIKNMPFSFQRFCLEFKLLIIRYQGSKFMYLFSGPITFKTFLSLHHTDLEDWTFSYSGCLALFVYPKGNKKSRAIPNLFWLL